MKSPQCCTTRFLGISITGALLLSPAMPAVAIDCSTISTVKKPFYRGKASSDVYDNRFKESHRIPSLPRHVPQGLAAWSNWQGTGDDLLLITAYDPEKRYTLIVGIDAQTGKEMGTAKIEYTHGGGIAVFEPDWAFVSDDNAQRVRKYPLKALADAISISDPKPLKSAGPEQRVFASSFLTSHGPTRTLWAGNFSGSAKGHMESYKVEKSGRLLPVGTSWEVPTKTQGVVVTKDYFFYSTSLDRDKRSNLYVVRRGKGETNLEDARLFCFRSPSMSEGIAIHGDDLYVLYESGADKFNPDTTLQNRKPNRPRNIISNLHRAPLASLEELPPRSGPTRPGPIAPEKNPGSR